MNFDVLFPLLFLAVFQLFGGTALGLGLRSTLTGGAGAGFFFIIWGAGFGGIPALIGTAMAFAEPGMLRIAWFPLAVFVGAAVSAFALWYPLAKHYGVAPTIGVALGAILLLGGVLLAALAFGQRGGTLPTVIGGALFLTGGAIVALAAGAILRST